MVPLFFGFDNFTGLTGNSASDFSPDNAVLSDEVIILWPNRKYRTSLRTAFNIKLVQILWRSGRRQQPRVKPINTTASGIPFRWHTITSCQSVIRTCNTNKCLDFVMNRWPDRIISSDMIDHWSTLDHFPAVGNSHRVTNDYNFWCVGICQYGLNELA